jgi:hypothetical protein
MSAKHQTTKMTVKLFQPMYVKFSRQLAAMPLLKDAFIEEMILSELTYLKEDLSGKVNSDAARRYIAGRLKSMGPKDKELEPVSIKVSVSTAARLRRVVEQHNLCRDAFVNFLFACLRSEDRFLEYLGLSNRVGKIGWQSGVEDMPTSPLKAIEVSLSDPLYYMRSECQDLYGCGLYALELPAHMHGFSCYLPDRMVPGTAEHSEFQTAFDSDPNASAVNVRSSGMAKAKIQSRSGK